ncbi:MAG: tRNA guanosine(34) transglycosylase Tgt [Deltaproteobacteria bacterium]|nr:tRNA guanosine(34) transglycosylase Tgt [Deltaproteobacteria bacterium]
MSFSFKLTKQGKGTKARLGEITTSHGKIQTPVFMPVGTVGTVKAMRPDELKTMGAKIILGNTYHLYLRPGHERIKRLGGLHRFMNWDGPILTDSGGYQVFSLGREPEKRQVSGGTEAWERLWGKRDEANPSLRNTKLARITDEGVKFQSHVDGSEHWITPEISIQIQQALGSDIMMAFDDCTAYPADRETTRKSMERTIDWEKRSLAAHTNPEQALFGIVQGGMYSDLRKECMERLLEMNEINPPSPPFFKGGGYNESPALPPFEKGGQGGFKGFALGGLSVGEPIEQMYEIAAVSAPLIPEKYPRYLMGVGMPENLITCIDMGLDMFDCVIPTRNARNGMLFTQTGSIYIKQEQYTEDPGPIDATCRCYTCANYSRAYLRHLHMAKEILSSVLSTIHNLHYYLDLLQTIRKAIAEDRFAEFKNQFFITREPT